MKSVRSCGRAFLSMSVCISAVAPAQKLPAPTSQTAVHADDVLAIVAGNQAISFAERGLL